MPGEAAGGQGEDLFWNGYKVHFTETCDDSDHNAPDGSSGEGSSGGDGSGGERPNLITGVETTDATVPDAKMTDPIHAALARRNLLPAGHYLDSGYPSAELVVDSARRWGVALVTPLLADSSPQARAGAGYDRAAFAIDFDAKQATCPQGRPAAAGTRSPSVAPPPS